MILTTKNDCNSYCGLITIIGKPNVGKSTLLNKLVGKKISIITDKPQTTRQKILGIKTIANRQAIFVDTPGIHSTSWVKHNPKMNKLMNKSAKSALKDTSLILFVIENIKWDQEDNLALQQIKKINLNNPDIPVWLLLNKIDLIKNQNLLLPTIEKLTKKYNFNEIFPISANKNIGLINLEQQIFKLLPEAPHYYLHSTTDQSLNFRIAEIIREKLIKNLEQELPYTTKVEITKMEPKKRITNISAAIWVTKYGQKKIIIGFQGKKLKQIGTEARLDLEKLLNHKVFLELWVQVKPNWQDNLTLYG